MLYLSGQSKFVILVSASEIMQKLWHQIFFRGVMSKTGKGIYLKPKLMWNNAVNNTTDNTVACVDMTNFTKNEKC